jgi:hypothetical protein
MPQRLRAHWSKYEVVAAHNTNFPPATPPTDALPEECKVELLVDTEGVADGAPARLQVMHAVTRAAVPGAAIEGLVVRGGKVVDPATGKPPVWSATARQLPWEQWDKPFFYFVAAVGELAGESPRDWEADPTQVVRVRWLFNLVADQLADEGIGKLTTRDEVNELAALVGRSPSTASHKTTIAQPVIQRNEWGSVLRDCYAYHHACHGVVLCLRCHYPIVHPPGRLGTPVTPPARGLYLAPTVCTCGDQWQPGQSVIAVDDFSQYLGHAEVADAAAVPSTPRYLAYLDCCRSGWEPSLADALIARGTQNVIGFHMAIPDDDARLMARRFYTTWVGAYGCDPTKIAEVFFQVAPPFWRPMGPHLFGAGGGTTASREREATNAAIGDALGG